MTLSVGQRETLFAAAYDQQGNLIPSARFSFWSSDTSVARVERDGSVLGLRPGLAKVEARLQGRRASVAVLVSGAATASDNRKPPPAGSVLTINPSALTLLPGERATLTTLLLRDDGSATSAGVATWKSLRAEVAVVDTNGAVIAVSPGKTILQAMTSSGLMATAPVEVAMADIELSETRVVLGPEDADTVHVVVPAQGGRRVSGGIQWSTTDSAVASVGPDGVVVGRAVGHAELVAAGLSRELRAIVVVHRTPQTLVLSPRPTAEAIQVPAGGGRKFSAIAEAADSSPIPEANVRWVVGDTALVAFDPKTGLARAKAPGTTTLTARLRGFEPAVWTIEIIPGVIRLNRERLGLIQGQAVTLEGHLHDDDGKVIGPLSAVEWGSDHPEVATVSASGEVTGLRPGHAVVSAAAPWRQRAALDVFVVADMLVSSDRAGALGVYQLLTTKQDSFLPLLLDGANNVDARFSPDRTRIAFSSDRSGTFDLYVMDADGQKSRRVSLDPGREAEPAWTPDGARIIFTAAPRAGVPQVMSITPDGSDLRTLTTSAGGNHSAAVAPDGGTIAFVSARDGNPDIYEMSLDGSNQRRVTKSRERESHPRFFPNGDLAYVIERGGGSRVVRKSPGAGPAVSMLQTARPIVAMDISRDGTKIVYLMGRLQAAGKQQTRRNLILQTLEPGHDPVEVPLGPTERALSPSF